MALTSDAGTDGGVPEGPPAPAFLLKSAARSPTAVTPVDRRPQLRQLHPITARLKFLRNDPDDENMDERSQGLKFMCSGTKTGVGNFQRELWGNFIRR
jgi:hypothetical protein